MRARTSHEIDNIDYYANQTLNILNTQCSTEQHVGHFLVYCQRWPDSSLLSVSMHLSLLPSKMLVVVRGRPEHDKRSSADRLAATNMDELPSENY